MATHSSILAWRIPGTGDRGGLLSMSHRVGHDWSDLAAAATWCFMIFQFRSANGGCLLCTENAVVFGLRELKIAVMCRDGQRLISKELVKKLMKVKVKSLSRVWLFATPWTLAYQAPPFMGFSRQGYWSGLPLPSPIKHHTFHYFVTFEHTDFQKLDIYLPPLSPAKISGANVNLKRFQNLKVESYALFGGNF